MDTGFEVAVFDLDGVLIDSEAVNIHAMQKTFGALGRPLTANELAMIPERSSQEMVPLLLRSRGLPEERDQPTIDIVRHNYDQSWRSMVMLMPETRKVLKHLTKAGVVLAIGTTNRAAVAERFVMVFEFENVFSFIISGEMVKKKKPDPEVYALAAERSGRPRDRILVIEDTEVGVEAAKAAKLFCAAVPGYYSQSHDFSSADYTFPSLAGILPLFKLSAG